MPSPRVERASWNTLRVRLTLWNTVAVLAMAAAVLFTVRIGARAALLHEADTVLRGEMNEIDLAVRRLRPDTDAVVEVLRRKADSHESRGWFTQLLTEDGRTVWRSDGCPEIVASAPLTATDRDEIEVQVGNWRYLRRRLRFPDGDPIRVRIGMSTISIETGTDGIMKLLVPVGLTLAILTPFMGWWLAGRATQPVGNMLRTAADLRPTRLSERLPVRGTGDELDRLAETINALLDQVAEHVEGQERFVADAAHELRGPLAAVRSSLEVALSQDRDSAEYRDTLCEVLEETNNLSRLANDLLLLAESSEVSVTGRMASVDLSEVARRTAAMFAGVAEERGITIDTESDGGLPMTADATKLRRLVGNLIDNAVRFTPGGGKVAIRIGRDEMAREAVLTVRDTGRGISGEHLPMVFERFYKADAARPREETGRSGGLGLAICRAIVEAHRGRITIESDLGRGTTVTCRLPFEPPRGPGIPRPPNFRTPAGTSVTDLGGST